jgi:hypothetical protein
MQVEFRPGRVDAGDGGALIADFAEEIAGMYAGLGAGMPKAGPDELGPPDGTFLVGYAAGGPAQVHAIALYEAECYRPIGNFNDNPVASWFGERSLV